MTSRTIFIDTAMKDTKNDIPQAEIHPFTLNANDQSHTSEMAARVIIVSEAMTSLAESTVDGTDPVTNGEYDFLAHKTVSLFLHLTCD